MDEEVSEDLASNIQPLKQLRDALDHLMRVVAVEVGFSDIAFSANELPDNFIDQNLEEAIRHFYRAFFDACDSVSISYREGVRSNLEDFSKEAILAVLPDYYPVIRPRMIEIDDEIAAMRNNKGQRPNSFVDNLDQYVEVLGELKAFYKATIVAQVALIEFAEKEKKEVEEKAAVEKEQRRKSIVFQITLGVACTALGVVLGSIFG